MSAYEKVTDATVRMDDVFKGGLCFAARTLRKAANKPAGDDEAGSVSVYEMGAMKPSAEVMLRNGGPSIGFMEIGRMASAARRMS